MAPAVSQGGRGQGGQGEGGRSGVEADSIYDISVQSPTRAVPLNVGGDGKRGFGRTVSWRIYSPLAWLWHCRATP